MSVKRVLFVVLVVSVAVLAVGAQAQPAAKEAAPPGVTIPYSGRLANEAGQLVVNGAYAFEFALYESEIGGEPLWSEVQEGIAVGDGMFAVTLGSASPIPVSVAPADAWLSVAVRGPGEAEFTALDPRQRLVASGPASPASPNAGAACPHDHVGEVWWANIAWSNAALTVNNSGSGPSILAWNLGNGNALRGQATGTGLGLYAESEDGAGAVGRSTTGHGVEGYSTSGGSAGVFAENNAGYGVYAHSDNGWCVYCQGDMRVTENFRVWGTSDLHGYVTFHGGKSGYVVEVAQNDDAVPLEVGDVVVISGAGPAVVGEIPVIKVRRAAEGETSAVVGVVDKHYIPAPPEAANSAETEGVAVFAEESVAPGEYLTIVTLGSYGVIKVDASYGAIAPGDLLVASPNPGYAMRADSPAPGAILGKALSELTSGTGLIPVMITLN